MVKPQQLHLWLHLSGVRFGYALHLIRLLLEKCSLNTRDKYFCVYLRILKQNLVKKALRNGNSRITELLGLQVTSGAHLAYFPCSSWATYLQRWDSKVSLGNPCQWLITSTVKKDSLVCSDESSRVLNCVHWLFYCHWVSLRKSHSLSPFRYL